MNVFAIERGKAKELLVEKFEKLTWREYPSYRMKIIFLWQTCCILNNIVSNKLWHIRKGNGKCFFFYSEIGELEHNAIVKSAFWKMMFEKLQSEGYCDINPLIGRTGTSKSEIENNLKKLDPPLVILFFKCTNL